MKNWNWLLLGLVLGLCACGSPKYEKAIATWIQTDKEGVWTDLKFELLDLIEEKDVTVSDSLQYLEEEGARQEEFIKRIDDYNNNLFVTSFYDDIKYYKVKDYLKRIEKKKTEYKKRDTTEVLAKRLLCKYAIVPPTLKTRQEQTNEFLLTPDKSRCLGRLPNKKR